MYASLFFCCTYDGHFPPASCACAINCFVSSITSVTVLSAVTIIAVLVQPCAPYVDWPADVIGNTVPPFTCASGAACAASKDVTAWYVRACMRVRVCMYSFRGFRERRGARGSWGSGVGSGKYGMCVSVRRSTLKVSLFLCPTPFCMVHTDVHCHARRLISAVIT